MKNVGDYHVHYLKKDVLLLANVFEKFIDTCLKFYGLDPCHYFSSPGLSWDPKFKMTGVRLEKIVDIDMYVFIEKELRGGISYIAKRYAKANNKYLKDDDLTKLLKYILYLDMNSLYGWAMTGNLLYGGSKWLKNVNWFDVNSIIEKNPIGYILEVNLEYPDKLHALHNDYPLAPEKLAIPYDMLSNYYKKIGDKYGIKVGDVVKLIPNLGNKTNYVLHYRNLQLHLSLGMKLTKIHGVLKFKSYGYMKKHIEFNTEKRRNTANSFEKHFFKLMINDVYGKTMENVRKIINVRLVNMKSKASIHEIKLVLKLNKPTYVGFTVLELSKWLMYDFHYNFIKIFFDAELLFTDTDSLTYEIKSKDVYEEFLSTNICLILVTFQKIKSFLTRLVKNLMVK